MTARRSFDVVVVAYASRDTIEHCIERVGTLRGVGDLVVVDHGTDGTADVAETLGARVFRNPGNPGFGAGQNRDGHADGFRKAVGNDKPRKERDENRE